MPKPRLKEGQIQAIILSYLALKKIFHYRQNSGALKTEHGFHRYTSLNGLPDIIAIINGRYIGIEVKSATGRLSQTQKETHEKIKRAGGEVFVVRSFEEIEQIIKNLLGESQ